MVNEINNFWQGLYPSAHIHSLMGIMGESLDPTLNIHISCYITDTDGRCTPMNLGCLQICLVGITPSNNQGTEREILPYMVRDSLMLPYMVTGYPHWSWNTIPEQGNTVSLYHYQISHIAIVNQWSLELVTSKPQP